MQDALAERYKLDVAERAASPVEEFEALGILPALERHVLLECARARGVLDIDRVVDYQMHRNTRVHLGRIPAAFRDGVA